MPITEFVFQIRMLVENHQTTLAFQIPPHELRHAVLRWYTYEHVDVVRHEMTFDYLYSLVTAELPQYLADTFLVLTVYCLAAIFRRKYYMIFTEPFCMAQRISDIYFPPWRYAIDLNNLLYTFEESFFCYKHFPTTRIAGGFLLQWGGQDSNLRPPGYEGTQKCLR